MGAKPPFKKLYVSMPIRLSAIACIIYLITFSSLKFTQNYWIEILASITSVPSTIFISAISLFITSIFAIVITYLMFDRPLHKLENTMRKAEEGNFLVRAPVISRFELGRLSLRFNRMLAHITTLAAKQAQAEHELVVAQEELKYRRQIEDQKKQLEDTNRHLEHAVKDLSLLYEIGQEISTIADFATLYSRLAKKLHKYLKLTQVAILSYDERSEILEVKAVQGFKDEKKVLRNTFKKGEGICGRAVATSQRIYVKDTSTDKRFLHYKTEPFEGPASLVAVPLTYKGETLGVINYVREGRSQFSFADVRMLTLVANQVSLAIANAKLYTKTRQLSVTDELTGLYNRRHLQQALSVEWKRAVRFKRPLSLLMIDIDNFKKYNDSYGHPQGDVALKKISKTMQRNLREVDLVSRFGGEEFVALLPDTDKHGATAAAEKIRQLIEALDYETKDGKKITISIGVANYPDDVGSVEDILDHSDIALYRAKENGKNQVMCFSEPIKKPEDKKIEDNEEEETTVRQYIQ